MGHQSKSLVGRPGLVVRSAPLQPAAARGEGARLYGFGPIDCSAPVKTGKNE